MTTTGITTCKLRSSTSVKNALFDRTAFVERLPAKSRRDFDTIVSVGVSPDRLKKRAVFVVRADVTANVLEGPP
jgi:hypothetical protein